MSRLSPSGALFALSLITGCAASATQPHHPGSLRIDKASPPAGARVLGEVRGSDGHGCGIGAAGTRQAALKKLRAQAEALGADYVEITREKEPYVDHQCKHREYLLEGTAYRVHVEPAPAAPTAPILPTTPGPAPAVSGSGMLLGANGCGFRVPAATPNRAIAFTARAPKNFRVWIDVSEHDELAPGLVLVYDRATQRLVLQRYPGDTPLSVGREPFELDEGWHAWRVQRTPEQLIVTLDGQQVLVYIAPAATGEAGFRLGGDALELKDIALF